VRTAVILVGAFAALAAAASARDKCAPPVVIPGIKGDSTTSKFGDGYITRTSAGKSYTTSKFGNGWITRGSDGQSFTTTKFGDGAITRGSQGQSVTTSRFGSGTISRTGSGPSTTISQFGSGYISRESGTTKAKEQGTVRVILAPKKN